VLRFKFGPRSIPEEGQILFRYRPFRGVNGYTCRCHSDRLAFPPVRFVRRLHLTLLLHEITQSVYQSDMILCETLAARDATFIVRSLCFCLQLFIDG